MAVAAPCILPAGRKSDPGMAGAIRAGLYRLDLQSQPVTVPAPLLHGCQIEPGLLDRQGSGLQMVYPAEHIGTVAGTHQLFRIRGMLPGMVAAAALLQ